MRSFAIVVLLCGCNSAASPTVQAEDAKEKLVVKAEPKAEPEPAKVEVEEEAPEAPKERIRIVSIDPLRGSLADQLLVEAGKAKQAGKTPYVELWAGWCPPCKRVDALLEDPALQEQLGSVVLIRVDTDQFNKPLTKLGFKSPTIPAFYEVDGRGKPTARMLQGHTWTEKSKITANLPAFLLGGS